MAVLSREEFMARLQNIVGEDTSEEAIKILEDFSDTYTDFETRTSDSTNWKKEYERIDAEWRQKYRDRFFSGGDETTPQQAISEQIEDVIEDGRSDEMTFNDLFEERED